MTAEINNLNEARMKEVEEDESPESKVRTEDAGTQSQW